MARKAINVTYSPQARVYTHAEVKQIVENVKRAFRKDLEAKAAILAEADKADAERIQHVVYLWCLNQMGLQRAGLMDLQDRVADACESINENVDNYFRMRKQVEGVLGYELHDFRLQDELVAQLEEVIGDVPDGQV